MAFEQAQIDAAIASICNPIRLAQAQDLVTRAAPDLQRVLTGALTDGGWFDTAHEAAVHDALAASELDERKRAVESLFAEETRLSMLVGVAVGFELAHELGYSGARSPAEESTTGQSTSPAGEGTHPADGER